MAPPGSRRQTLLRSVLWPWLLREAGRFLFRLFLPFPPARRASSARPIPPARRGKFRSARAFPGWRANPRAKFPAAKDFPSEIFRPFRYFSCVPLQTIFPRPAPVVRSIPFLRILFRELLQELPEFLF